jgi:hypothetical protein
MGTIEYSALPLRSFPEHTVRVPAGPVVFGVEYRHLDEATVLAEFGPGAEERFNGGQRPAGMGAVLDEDGVSLHVFRADTGEELFRADCFEDAPHVHYLTPGDPPRNVVVEHDLAAGPLLDAVLAEMGANLAGILRRAGAPDVADALEAEKVASALTTVGQVARYVAAAGRPVPVG